MPDLPPITRRHSHYNWPRHATTLTTRPGEWVMLEPDISTGMLTYLRTGQQPDLAHLHPHLELRMRGTAGTRRGELWGRYDPTRTPTPARQVIPDTVVRHIRETYAAGGTSTAQLAKAHNVSQSYISAVVLGERRASAGGPIVARTRKAGDAR